MTMFPGRFPNEILEELDIALFMQVMRARTVEQVEAKRVEFLKLGTDLSKKDWLAIREHDELMDDYTIRIETDGVGA